MKRRIAKVLFAACLALAGFQRTAAAQEAEGQAAAEAVNRIEDLQAAEQGGVVFVRITLKQPLASPPASFSVANPARIAFDFPKTANGLGRSVQDIGQGDLRSANIVQAGDRTRMVLNLTQMTPYETKLDGRNVLITLTPLGAARAPSAAPGQAFANFADSKSLGQSASSIRDITFRRGADGAGRILVQLSDPQVGIDVRRQGPNLVVDFLNTTLPENLRRRSDVTDFATPVTTMTAQPQGNNARLVVTPSGNWEHNAYQSDNQFVLEVKRVIEDPNKLVQGSGHGKYQGEKLSLNFQNIDVRSVLQVIADFTDFNIITSDSVQGNLTLRLKDVPWDQALDIILQSKGLDMRKNGNVIWIAPADELATREKLQLEAQAQIGDLEPLQTESFQINYHKAKEIFDFLKSKDQTILSKRGSVVVDERSNKVFVTDVGTRLEALRKLITEIDVPPRQVLIEARIVEANKDFSRDLGVRLGVGDAKSHSLGGGANIGLGKSEFVSFKNDGTLNTDANALLNGTIRRIGESATSGAGAGQLPTGFGALNLTLFNSGLTRFLNLELQAMEADQRGRIISSPRVLTANQVEATIEQGTEIPYEQSTSSGATSVSFKKAVLSLKVKPQITPDGRLQLTIAVNKDRPVFDPRFSVPAIETKNVKSEVLIDNGGTVVIGGIYQEEESNDTARVPVLGEIPVLGALFRTTSRVSNRSELLVFITPRVVSDALSLR